MSRGERVPVGTEQRPAAPTRLCAVNWCLAEPAGDGTVCAVHKKHPDFKPEELEAKEGHFEAVSAWVEQDCRACGGSGEVDHDCDCDHCSTPTDDCGACDGDGKRETCSVCGFQSGWETKQKEHEATCWGATAMVIEKPAGEARA